MCSIILRGQIFRSHGRRVLHNLFQCCGSRRRDWCYHSRIVGIRRPSGVVRWSGRSRQGASGQCARSFPLLGGVPSDPNFTLRPHAEIESGIQMSLPERHQRRTRYARNPLLPKHRAEQQGRRSADGYRPAPDSRPRVACDCVQSVSISTFRSTVCEDLSHRTIRPNHARGGPSSPLGRLAAAATRSRPRRIASAACL